MGGAVVSPFLAVWKALQSPLGKVGLLRVKCAKWGGTLLCKLLMPVPLHAGEGGEHAKTKLSAEQKCSI